MVSDVSLKSVRASHLFVVCLVLVAVSTSSAAPAKTKSATTKQSSAPELKADAANAPVVNAAVGPVVCVKPADPDATPAATSDEQSSTAAKAAVSDTGITSDSASESNPNFMKDKLKLSLGGKAGAASDQPQQCGIDEAKEK